VQTIHLSDKTLTHLREAAALRGLDTDAYADELLAISLAVLREKNSLSPLKPHHAMEFSAVAPSGRTASEIDAEIEAGREEWDGQAQDTAGETTSDED
jgi:hypothetical protein